MFGWRLLHGRPLRQTQLRIAPASPASPRNLATGPASLSPKNPTLSRPHSPTIALPLNQLNLVIALANLSPKNPTRSRPHSPTIALPLNLLNLAIALASLSPKNPTLLHRRDRTIVPPSDPTLRPILPRTQDVRIARLQRVHQVRRQ
jgi:hypothetical protein